MSPAQAASISFFVLLVLLVANFLVHVGLEAARDRRERRERLLKGNDPGTAPVNTSAFVQNVSSTTNKLTKISLYPVAYPTPAHMRMPSYQATEYILGWRTQNGIDGSWGIPWTAGFMGATCKRDSPGVSSYARATSHSAPHLDCACGIYSTKKLATTSGGLLVLVAQSGTIIEHDLGYRSEEAQIVAFTVIAKQHPYALQAADLWKGLGITQCRSVEKLTRVYDFYSKNPNALYDEVERLALERQFHLSPEDPEPSDTEEMPF